MRRHIFSKCTLVVLVLTLFFLSSLVSSHCQIPCGIYDDELRFAMLREHIQTIEKTISEINKLKAEGKEGVNQIVRWIANKDQHADDFSGIVTYYFMAQRVRPIKRIEGREYARYLDKITLLHRMIYLSMKCKQETDMVYVEDLKVIVDEFEKIYFAEIEAKQS